MNIFRKAAVVVTSGLLMSGMSVPTWAAMPAGDMATPCGSQLIDRLASTEQLDWRYATDPTVAPVTRSDFLDQMNKADEVLKLATQGFKVPERELADALLVPPKSITSEESTRLVHELQEARREDDHNEQTMLNGSAWNGSDGGGAPVDTVTFDQQKELVDSVVKDLETGKAVHWSTIKEALYVPPSPY
jgi:hypothetical protein